MVGIKSRLSRSVFVLFVFYSAIYLLYFLAMSPDGLSAWLSNHGRPYDGHIDPLNILGIQLSEISYRFNQVWPWFVGGCVLALAITASVYSTFNIKFYVAGSRRSNNYRGLKITIGTIPQPEPLSCKKVNAVLPSGISNPHKKLILEILGYLSLNKKAFVGDGHGDGTLLDHTMNVMERALDVEDADPLLLVAAAAHDIGKTVSHIKTPDGWKMVAYHDKEGAKILSKMDSWWAMDDVERSILAHAIRYEHSKSKMPCKIPGLSSDDVARAANLLSQLQGIDGQATADEKEQVLEEIDVGQVVIDAFLKALPKMQFQRKGASRGATACGWRQGDRLYMIEHRVRDSAMKEMATTHAAALGGEYRGRGQLSNYSSALFEKLDDLGWLIKTLGTKSSADAEEIEATVSADFPLWSIAAGTKTFQAIFVIELPDEMRGMYPEETPYGVEVRGPMPNPFGKPVVKEKPEEKPEENQSGKDGKPESMGVTDDLDGEVEKKNKPDKTEKKPFLDDKENGNTVKSKPETTNAATVIEESAPPKIDVIDEIDFVDDDSLFG